MQSEEQSELRRYLHLTKASRDIETKIHPYYEKMYPTGVGQMTALDPELSNAPLAMKIEFYSAPRSKAQPAADAAAPRAPRRGQPAADAVRAAQGLAAWADALSLPLGFAG